MMVRFLNKIYHPEIYQGAGKNKNYFEGWYYKIVDKTEKSIYAVIPGAAFGSNNSKTHCFIQILGGTEGKSAYIKYDINTFKYNREKFEIWVGNSYFSTNGVLLDIECSEFNIKGKMNFIDITPWPKRVLSPNSMGWYAFMPFMECYHGIISLGHGIEGGLRINNEDIDFTGGRGYTEKDWGKSFPSSWIWIQSNHFEKGNDSVTCSIANIPWLGKNFIGLIAGLKLDNRIYRFTTYTGAKINKNNIGEDFAKIEIEDRNHILNIDVKKSNSAELLSPKNGMMDGFVKESMNSNVTITLYKKYKYNNELIFKGAGKNTAVEIAGDIQELYKMQ